MSGCNLVIFDIDGTLLDTTEGIESAVRYTIREKKLPELTSQQIRAFVGPPIQDSFSRAYGIEDKEYLQELAGIFRDRYKDYDLFKARPYDGIYEVCDRLRQEGISMAVATYKREDYAVSIMEHFGFDRYMSAIYGGDHENKLKKKDIIMKCLTEKQRRMENGKSEEISELDAVMVGDTMHDAAGAEEAGIDFIGVTYGFGFQQKSEIMHLGCAGGADTPLELLKLIF